MDEYLDIIEKIDPLRLRVYEEATGIALARANVDFSSFQRSNAEAEERRLMPKYVKKHFIEAARENLRAREAASPEVAIARQRADNILADLQRTRKERMEGLERLNLARHGPVRHVATAILVPPGADIAAQLAEDIDPEIRRRSELAAEDIVIAHEEARGWTCERVGHLKIGFDVRSLGPADPQTGYRDPIEGIRRIEVKGRMRGQPIRLTTNEWYKATQLGDSYWLYVVWDPLDGPSLDPLRIRNPAKHLDHAKKEVVAARYYDISAEAVEQAASQHRH